MVILGVYLQLGIDCPSLQALQIRSCSGYTASQVDILISAEICRIQLNSHSVLPSLVSLCPLLGVFCSQLWYFGSHSFVSTPHFFLSIEHFLAQ